MKNYVVLLVFSLVMSGCSVDAAVYFCPKENCAEHIREELQKAEEEILFATYAFTHGSLGTQLILIQEKNVVVKGVIEKQTSTSKHSQFEILKKNDIDVVRDGNYALMHNKVFVIDRKTVITGSFNPSENADKRNNENVIILRDEKLARRYADEIERIIKEGE